MSDINPNRRRHLAPRDNTGRRRFRRGLLVWLCSLTIVLAAALLVLWTSMSRFQQRQDLERERQEREQLEQTQLAQAPRRAFEAFLETTDADYWTELYFDAHPDTQDDREAARALFGELFDADTLSCFRSADWTEQTPLYVLKNGDRRLATVALDGSGLDWAASDVRLFVEGELGASVTVPDGCVVSCNGQPLGDEYAAPAEQLYDFEEYGDRLKNPVCGVTYTIGGLLTEPRIEVAAPEGLTLTEGEDAQMLLALPDSGSGTFRSDAETFVRALVRYYLRGSINTEYNMNVTLARAVAGSQAFEVVRKAYDGIIWGAPYTPSIDSLECSEVVVWADNCRSVDVECHATGVIGADSTSVDSIYRIYFYDFGQGYGLRGLEQRSAD